MARELSGHDLLMANALYDIYAAAKALDAAEDFSEMPCQHACCAPQDWASYQAARQALADALRRVEALANERSGGDGRGGGGVRGSGPGGAGGAGGALAGAGGECAARCSPPGLAGRSASDATDSY